VHHCGNQQEAAPLCRANHIQQATRAYIACSTADALAAQQL
jgi:hypothetical protein